MSRIKVALADNHHLFREGLAALLKTIETDTNEHEIEVVFEAVNAKDLLDRLSKAEVLPDVILLDLNMTDSEDRYPEVAHLDGPTALKEIKKDEAYNTVKIIVLSMYKSQWLIADLMKSGANGYLFKNVKRPELMKAIKTVLQGDNYYNQQVSNAILASSMPNQGVHGDSKLHEKPTKRELEVLQLLAKGLTNKAIAKELFISPKTVDRHRTSLLAKFEVQNIAGLISKAFRSGYLKLEE